MHSKTQRVCDEFLNNPALTVRELKRLVGCSEKTVKNGRRRARRIMHEKAKNLPAHIRECSDTVSGSERSIITTSSDIKTLEDLLFFSDISLDEWEVVKHSVNAWGSETNENFQVKAWLKKRGDELSVKDYIKEFKDAVDTHVPYKYKPIKYKHLSDNAAEIAIHDLHFGSLCWKAETGENYDIKIATKIYMDAINYFAGVIDAFSPGEIMLPIGSDFFNVNSMLNQTTAGTSQDEDGRWQKTYVYGRKMAVLAIDILQEIAPVKVFIIPGNHDTERSFYLGDSLECWYRGCKNVTIDNTPTTRKYWAWGKCLVGMVHGNEEAKGTLPLIMADSVPELWVNARYKEWHTGHLHHKSTKSYDYATETRGVRERILASLAATDSWHSKKGYSGLREAETFIWNKDHGNIASFAYHPY